MSGTRFVLTATGFVLGVLLLAGCPQTPSGGGNDNVLNDNSMANENDNAAGGANTNENGGGVPNVNDNESENVNGSANENVADNENDSGAGNDNTAGGANDNTAGNANDNAADNANDNAAGNVNDNATGNVNENAADNANDNASGNDNGGGGGGGGGNANANDNANDNSSGEGTEQVGCPGFDEVVLAVTPFAGSTAPDPLPDMPVTVLVGDPWGVVVDVGDLGNNTGSPPFLLVTLDDNELNGNTGLLLDASFIDSEVVFTILPLPSSQTGTFFVTATLVSADASDVGCDNVAQVYNTQVTVTFESP